MSSKLHDGNQISNGMMAARLGFGVCDLQQIYSSGSILAFDCCPLFEFKFKRVEGEGGRDEGDKLGAES